MRPRIVFTAFLFSSLPILAGSTPSTVTLTSATNPSTFGQAITFTAIVKPATATGAVTFYSGTTVLETEPVVSGSAKLTTTLLTFGFDSVRAYYSGDGSYSASTSAVITQTVNAKPGYGFHPEVIYSGVSDAYFSAIGDFNGDGKQDLAIANLQGGVSVLLGNGDGTFQPAVSYPSDADAVGIVTGDFNGDGIADLATADGTSNQISVFLGHGDGTFAAAVNYPATSGESIVTGDFNGDGRVDLATGGSGISVLLGNGDGSFQAPKIYETNGTAFSIAVGDFNGDGKPDLVATETNNDGISVLLGNGDGTFQASTTYTTEAEPNSVVVEDFNRDGNADLAVSDGSGALVFLGNGDGTFQTPASYSARTETFGLAVGDFNGDGVADLALVGQYVDVLLGNGDGTFAAPLFYPYTHSGTGALAVGDFNRDGVADLVTTQHNDTVGIFLAASAPESFTTLAANPNPSTYGQPVNLTVTVSPVNAKGTISFYSGFAGLGKSQLADGQATLTISTLSGGTQKLTALYNGDDAYPKSDSPVVTQTVNRASTFTGLTSSPDPSTASQTVTFTATVSSSTATGAVTFYSGSTSLGTGTVNAGIATLQATLASGKHGITAVYGGDNNYAPSTSPVRIQIVN